ncbi:MAG: hypothetical protein FJ144_24930 [Deltaproteobacteria bacterium]|nr:hypothetical protein [Deltaproteobacteria bacterium]
MIGSVRASAPLLAAIVVSLSGLAGAAPASDPKGLKARLGALGYVTAVTRDADQTRQGVTLYDSARASPGVNVYCSVRGSRAHLLDMSGKTLQSFDLPKEGLGRDCLIEPLGRREGFLVVSYPALARVDAEGRILWARAAGHHHDVAVADDGTILALAERPGAVESKWGTLPILDQTIVVLDPDGRVEKEISLARLFSASIPERRLVLIRRLVRRGYLHGRLYDAWADVFHANTIEVMGRDTAVAPRGSILICLRDLNLIAILDAEGERVLWTWGKGVLDGPHHPSLLENGNVLVFDNGRERGHSRVLEVNPQTRQVVWTYPATPSEEFLSRYRGSAQLLPNGNLLITESDEGHAFEIARSGDVVWDFYNPERIEKTGERRQIYRMVRVPEADGRAPSESTSAADR